MAKISKAYETIPSNICKFSVYFIYGFVAIIIFTISSRKIFNDTSTSEISLNDSSSIIKAITWNIAAINNNPFEYWITNSDPIYNKMMKDVSKYIETPGEYDIAVESIFSQTMYDDLENSMKLAGWKQVDLDETKQLWLNDYKNRKIISEFIKDPIIGKKRLASMPDRVTNTINTIVQGVVTRPTVINCYSGVDLSSINNWFNEWKSFMFDKKIKIFKKGVETELKILDLIQTIKKSKYPTLTEQEERVSLPLQTVCLAIFDSILVNMMNTIGKETWQPLREDMCNKLNRHKNERTIEILETTYADSDIQFLQEVAGSFQQSTVGSKLESKFDIYLPATIDSERDQNSFILLKKGKYKVLKEVTSEVILQFPKDIKIPIVNGDLFVLSVIDVISNDKYLLASFHGDTNGLATIPVVNAVTYLFNIIYVYFFLIFLLYFFRLLNIIQFYMIISYCLVWMLILMLNLNQINKVLLNLHNITNRKI